MHGLYEKVAAEDWAKLRMDLNKSSTGLNYKCASDPPTEPLAHKKNQADPSGLGTVIIFFLCGFAVVGAGFLYMQKQAEKSSAGARTVTPDAGQATAVRANAGLPLVMATAVMATAVVPTTPEGMEMAVR